MQGNPFVPILIEFSSNFLWYSVYIFDNRQACAIESTTKLNPDRDVFVLFASPVGFSNDYSATISPQIAALMSYPNIYMRNVDLWTFVRGTPFEHFFQSDKLFLSEHLVAHMADFLRLLSLYTFAALLISSLSWYITFM